MPPAATATTPCSWRVVAPGGTVHAFDLQAAAIERSRRRLDAAATGTSLQWYRRDHAGIGRTLTGVRLDGAMFNLGWLPRSDSGLVTTPAATTAALAATLPLLRSGARMTVICYRGHAGGAREATAVRSWLGSADARVLAVEPEDPAAHGPLLYVVEPAPGESAGGVPAGEDPAAC
ncbi:MAG: class I SAM-dependent methyltransferase [Halofilum sp. (in: g-proteobacteria)]